MKLKSDPTEFLKQQEVFTGEMIARTANYLEEAGIKDNELKELVGKICFEIACMLDDVSGIEFDGDEAHPYLTFQSSDDDELVHFGGNSTTHEMVFGILNAMFKENS